MRRERRDARRETKASRVSCLLSPVSYPEDTPEAVDGLTVAGVSAPADHCAAADCGLYLDAAPPPAIYGALLHPGAGACGAAALFALATPPAVCAVPAWAD